ncbi:MAG: hypothetical protein K6G91_03265 [Kiritimatiellae bacterium]|nr:hypothetical protein [Kiritimatiellia bacterium]
MMSQAGMEIARITAVVALLAAAAAVAAPKGRVPLALRGLSKVLRRDVPSAAPGDPEPVSRGRRFLAFVLVVLAALAAVVSP